MSFHDQTPFFFLPSLTHADVSTESPHAPKAHQKVARGKCEARSPWIVRERIEPQRGVRKTAAPTISAARSGRLVHSSRSRGCVLRTCPWLLSLRASGADSLTGSENIVVKSPATEVSTLTP